MAFQSHLTKRWMTIRGETGSCLTTPASKQTGRGGVLGPLSLRTWCHLEGGRCVLCFCLFKAEVRVKVNEKQGVWKVFFFFCVRKKERKKRRKNKWQNMTQNLSALQEFQSFLALKQRSDKQVCSKQKGFI